MVKLNLLLTSTKLLKLIINQPFFETFLASTGPGDKEYLIFYLV